MPTVSRAQPAGWRSHAPLRWLSAVLLAVAVVLGLVVMHGLDHTAHTAAGADTAVTPRAGHDVVVTDTAVTAHTARAGHSDHTDIAAIGAIGVRVIGVRVAGSADTHGPDPAAPADGHPGFGLAMACVAVLVILAVVRLSPARTGTRVVGPNRIGSTAEVAIRILPRPPSLEVLCVSRT